jgi:hypothetical protein
MHNGKIVIVARHIEEPRFALRFVRPNFHGFEENGC